MRKPTAIKRRRPTAQRIKFHRSYRIDEVTWATGACKATIRRWIKNGLPTVQGSRPSLILGADLLEFMRKDSRRQTCGPAECFCFKCRAPRKPAYGMADYLPMTPTGGNLSAICAQCETLMHKRINLTTLERLRSELDLKIVERNRDLRDGR